jgi:hypothetical protein
MTVSDKNKLKENECCKVQYNICTLNVGGSRVGEVS